ncbi:MAG: AAA family ATPase [Egibacteraceae bacterium]
MTAALDDQELAARLAAFAARRLAAFDREGLTWLAVAPMWTDRLATSCGFPTGGEPIEEFVDRAAQAGICERRSEFGPGGEAQVRFWMPAPARVEALTSLGRDAASIEAALRTIGERIVFAERAGVEVTPSLARWAELAIDPSTAGPGAGDRLYRRVDTLTTQGNAEEALDVVYAGEALATVLGGDLESGVRRARRRINLEYRRVQDDRALRRFLRRDEQVSAVRRLLTGGPDDPWALHLIGMGGVGKTMLVRYVAGRLSSDEGLPRFPVGRADFDHISPLYPAERPGQLLRELADELAGFATTEDQDLLFGRSADAFVRADEVAQRRAPADPLAGIHSDAFDAALAAFRAFLRSLPQPVLLILDTCEELAKLHPPGSRPWAIDATFELLERIHEREPGLRVLFAGRRLLARSGAGWSADPSGGAVAVSVDDRPYLELHEIRGFTEDESRTFFRDVRGLDVPDAAVRTILDGSVAEGGADDRRYNPFDLALYADCFDDEGGLDVAAIAAGDTDTYIEARIVQRLRDADVLAALPAAACLGRFDEAMLRAGLPAGADAAGSLARLAEQEWVDVRSWDHPGETVCEINAALVPQLVRYYAHPSRAYILDETVARLGPGLRELVDSKSLQDLRVDHVEAALRYSAPLAAADQWDRLTQRIETTATWGWARGVCQRLLADETLERAPAIRAIRGAVQATQIGAVRHLEPDFDAWDAWEAVAMAADHPDPAAAAQLRVRSALGMATAWRPGRDLAWEAELAAVLESPTADLAPAVVAALENLLEQWGSLPPADVIGRWVDGLRAQGVHTALAAYAHCLHGRAIAAQGGDTLMARRAFTKAERWARDRSAAKPRGWADWVEPEILLDRVRLEWLWLEAVAGTSPDALPLDGRQTEATTRLESIDAERLCALILTVRLGHGVPPIEVFSTLRDAYRPERRPRCRAHRAVPPLFVAVARAWLAWGDPETALRVLDKREKNATASRRDPATVEAAHAVTA